MHPFVAISIIFWFGSVAFFTIRMMVDQLKLLKAYRERVNPPYPIAPGDARTKADFKADPLGLKMGIRQFQVLFAKDHKDESLAKLAKKVHIDLGLILVASLAGFILIGLMAYTFRS